MRRSRRVLRLRLFLIGERPVFIRPSCYLLLFPAHQKADAVGTVTLAMRFVCPQIKHVA
jgi:hypothetical protein